MSFKICSYVLDREGSSVPEFHMFTMVFEMHVLTETGI